MLHCLIYQGALERNFEHLGDGSSTYIATDGTPRLVAPRPPTVDGIVIGYMERTGKKFSVVRLQFEDSDISLRNPVPLDRMRHMGNRRFSPQPVLLSDELVSVLRDDILAQNSPQQVELALLINRVNVVRRGGRETIE
jgi:hypothetical protein